MSKNLLSLSVASPTTTNHSVLPLYFTYQDGTQIWFLLSATKVDAAPLLLGIEQISEKSQNFSAENFFAQINSLLDQTRFRQPITLTALHLDQDCNLLVMTWGGAVVLKRGQQAGILALGQPDKLVVKAGQLQAEDSILLFNSRSKVLTQPLIDNLNSAQNWPEFTFFIQAFFSQADFENLALSLISRSAQSTLNEEINSDPTVDTKAATEIPAAENPSCEVDDSSDKTDDSSDFEDFDNFDPDQISFTSKFVSFFSKKNKQKSLKKSSQKPAKSAPKSSFGALGSIDEISLTEKVPAPDEKENQDTPDTSDHFSRPT